MTLAALCIRLVIGSVLVICVGVALIAATIEVVRAER